MTRDTGFGASVVEKVAGGRGLRLGGWLDICSGVFLSSTDTLEMGSRHSPPPPSSRNRATTTSAASARAKPKSLLKRRPVPKDEHRKFGFATTDVAFAMAGDELVLADGAELPHVSRTVLHNTAANVEITLR
ncbi:hypothetical protein HDU99_009664, partial [Rhizoclosmatium hyalinum]